MRCMTMRPVCVTRSIASIRSHRGEAGAARDGYRMRNKFTVHSPDQLRLVRGCASIWDISVTQNVQLELHYDLYVCMSTDLRDVVWALPPLAYSHSVYRVGNTQWVVSVAATQNRVRNAHGRPTRRPFCSRRPVRRHAPAA